MGLVKPDKDMSRGQPAEPVADFATLLGNLDADQAKIRGEAVRALATMPMAIAPLCARLAQEDDPRVRELILVSLIRLNAPQVVSGLIDYVRSEDAGLRNDVVEALAQMPDLVESHIGPLLQDDDSDVRILTINILATLRHPKVPEWIAAVLAREAHPNVCAAAIDIAVTVGTPELVPILEQVRTRFADVPFIVFAVDIALRGLLPTAGERP